MTLKMAAACALLVCMAVVGVAGMLKSDQIVATVDQKLFGATSHVSA